MVWEEVVRFHWADYLVFFASLAVGLLIGIASLIRSRHVERSAREYLLGGGDMNIFLVGTSLLLSAMSAVFLLGCTAEVYYRGAIFLLIGIPSVINLFLNWYIFIPTWKKQHATSAYEYIEKRYGSVFLRCWAAFLFSVKYLLSLSIVLYTPAMALNQVTGINMHVAIVVCGFVCALYTSMGGLRAVVWTDAMQAVVLLAGLVVVCSMGLVRVGGLAVVFSEANKLGRLNFNNFNPHPHERHSVFALAIGITFTEEMLGLADQLIVQRYMAVRDTRAAQRANLVGVCVWLLCLHLVVLLGLITTVYYQHCDPQVSGAIARGDQLLPYFFMDILGPFPGLPGLFIAAIFAAALSTVSSVINSLAAVFLEDFIKPFKRYRGTTLSQENEQFYARVLSGVFGALTIALSYLAPLLGDAIIQIPPTIHGAIGAPLFFIFFAGFYIPWANTWGAIVGSVSGLLVNVLLGIGMTLYGKDAGEDNLPVGLCLSNASDYSPVPSSLYSTTWPEVIGVSTAEPSLTPAERPLQWLFDVSYVWIAMIGIVVSFATGLLTSAVTNYLGYGEQGQSKSVQQVETQDSQQLEAL